MNDLSNLHLLSRAKRRANFQVTIAACAFVFSVIILAIGCAVYDGTIPTYNAYGAYVAGVIFAIFEFGCCVAMIE